MQKIIPSIWCNNNAEEMADYYLSVFKNAKTLHVSRWQEGGHGPAGSMMAAILDLDGASVMLLNGGPQFPHTEFISLLINCDTQEDIDYYWDRLTADGGAPGQCGWLKDKFGVSWQVAPTRTVALLSKASPAQHAAWLREIEKMHKLDLEILITALTAA